MKKHFNLAIVLVISIFAISVHSEEANKLNGSLMIRGGDIIINGQQVTHAGNVKMASMSHDGTKIVYIKDAPQVASGWTSQLWLLDINTLNEVVLIGRTNADDVIKCREATEKGIQLYNALFSIDDQIVIFSCSYWAQSSAINIINITTSEKTFLKDGNGLWIIEDGLFKGNIITRQHRHLEEGGATDFFYIYDIHGNLKQVAGNTTEATCQFLVSHATSVPATFGCERDGQEEAEYRSRQKNTPVTAPVSEFKGNCEQLLQTFPHQTDIRSLFGVLSSAGFKKGDYETTLEYEKRKAAALAEVRKNLLQRQGHEFVVFYVNSHDTKYNADNQTLTVGRRTQYDTGPLWFYPDNLGRYKHAQYDTRWRTTTTEREILIDKYYVGTNSFGATVKVHKTEANEYGVAFDKGVSAGNGGWPSKDYTFSLKLPPDEARLASNHIAGLFVAKLTDAYFADYINYKKPTIDDPSDALEYRHMVLTHLECAAFINTLSKKVLRRVQ
ncbi:MAG: hypothetical protein WCO00_07945 [Rhodospirillaceae bacterium]